MNKIIIAPDSFKGSMSSKHVIDIISKVVQNHYPTSLVVGIPMADGGEGTVDILKDIMGGKLIKRKVHGPLMNYTDACYLLENHIAIIEMAQASGLTLLLPEERNPLRTTTLGTGELMLDAINRGAHKIILTIGGSATNDGGMGAAQALGIRFLDYHNIPLKPVGENLANVASIDTDCLDERLKKTEIQIICDVNNPLLGIHGAAYTYAKQKGADAKVMDQLETGMYKYARIIERKTQRQFQKLPGTGAAGGFVLPFIAFMNASLKPGIDTILDLIDFKSKITDADLVITGEGRTDEQSAHGKVLSGIGKICAENNIPCIAIVGGMGEGAEQIYTAGISSIMTTINEVMDIKTAINNCDYLLESATDRALRFIDIGRKLKD